MPDELGRIADIIGALPVVVQFDLSYGEANRPTDCNVCDVIWDHLGRCDDRTEDLLIAILEWHSSGVADVLPEPGSEKSIVSYLRCVYVYECATNALIL